MISRREDIAYKYPRIPCGEECHISVYKRENNAIHIQSNNTTALSYILKMGGTTDKTLVDVSKYIWNHLILKQITIAAEYISGILNTTADWQSCHSKDFSEWELSPIVFQYICYKMGMPVIDLLASRLSNQIVKHLLGNLIHTV